MSLRDMLPDHTLNDVIDKASGDAIYRGHKLLSISLRDKLPYLFNIVLRQSRPAVFLALVYAVLCSSFVLSIIGVICERTKKQVAGIATSTIIAFMKNTKLILKFTIKKFVGYSMSIMGFALTLIKCSVSIWGNMTLPLPTGFTIGKLYQCEKPLCIHYSPRISLYTQGVI